MRTLARLDGKYLRETSTGKLAIHRGAIEEAARYDGKRVITSNDDMLTAEDLALGCKQLLRVEQCWRQLESGLRMRPVFHYRPWRIQAHVTVSVLALLLERIVEIRTGDTWRNVRAELERVKLSPEDTAKIRVFAMDMHQPFASAVRADAALAHAAIVHDPFQDGPGLVGQECGCHLSPRGAASPSSSSARLSNYSGRVRELRRHVAGPKQDAVFHAQLPHARLRTPRAIGRGALPALGAQESSVCIVRRPIAWQPSRPNARNRHVHRKPYRCIQGRRRANGSRQFARVANRQDHAVDRGDRAIVGERDARTTVSRQGGALGGGARARSADYDSGASQGHR